MNKKHKHIYVFLGDTLWVWCKLCGALKLMDAIVVPGPDFPTDKNGWFIPIHNNHG